MYQLIFSTLFYFIFIKLNKRYFSKLKKKLHRIILAIIAVCFLFTCYILIDIFLPIKFMDKIGEAFFSVTLLAVCFEIAWPEKKNAK